MTATDQTETRALTHVLYGGDVYSSVDPFATALTFAGDTILWVGDDDTALAGASTGSELVDLAEGLVTPGFVDAALDVRGMTDAEAKSLVLGLVQAGITTVFPTGGAGLMAVDTAGDLARVEQQLTDMEWVRDAQRSGIRVAVFADAPLDVELWGKSGIPVTVNPHHDRDLHALFKAGAQVSFTLGGAPWEAVRAGVDHGLSARAAFNACTRFAHRAVGHAEAGVLAPGQAATMVQWSKSHLVVQVADQRVAAWSTDPRSGTPGLPDLGETLPTVTRVWVNGELG